MPGGLFGAYKRSRHFLAMKDPPNLRTSAGLYPCALCLAYDTKRGLCARFEADVRSYDTCDWWRSKEDGHPRAEA